MKVRTVALTSLMGTCLVSCRSTELVRFDPDVRQQRVQEASWNSQNAVANAGCAFGLPDGAGGSRVMMVERSQLPFQRPPTSLPIKNTGKEHWRDADEGRSYLNSVSSSSDIRATGVSRASKWIRGFPVDEFCRENGRKRMGEAGLYGDQRRIVEILRSFSLSRRSPARFDSEVAAHEHIDSNFGVTVGRRSAATSHDYSDRQC